MGRNWENGPCRRGGAGRREEEGQSTRGPAARRDGTPHRPTAQWRVRQAARPAGSLAAPSANDPTRASAARASERTYMAVGWVLSRMCNAARLAVPTHPTLPRRARASRAPPAASCATRNARHDPRATPARARPRVRGCVRARAYAQCGVRDGEARRLCPPSWCVRESRAHGAPRRRKRGTQQPTPHQPACVHAGLLLPHERAPEETKPDSRDVARLACAASPRVTQRTTHLEFQP